MFSLVKRLGADWRRQCYRRLQGIQNWAKKEVPSATTLPSSMTYIV